MNKAELDRLQKLFDERKEVKNWFPKTKCGLHTVSFEFNVSGNPTPFIENITDDLLTYKIYAAIGVMQEKELNVIETKIEKCLTGDIT